ncbi:hypothetical protein J437_LFUL002402 [Ladona fulva]|uniref:Uncharacterized protein n=1 Tax=Ladona fulva TaxID=123851 RepID=A0A8K0K3X1_LADFU|nr:hypothetical protein J437_LFUL002402 [Ladona fulva]
MAGGTSTRLDERSSGGDVCRSADSTASPEEPPPSQANRAAEPRDGGARAWMVLVASFLTNGIVFGVINSYSVIYVNLQEKLKDAGVPEASSKACESQRLSHSLEGTAGSA